MAKSKKNMKGPTHDKRDSAGNPSPTQRGRGAGGLKVPSDAARSHKAEASTRLIEDGQLLQHDIIRRKKR
jgi:hypothetical protein